MDITLTDIRTSITPPSDDCLRAFGEFLLSDYTQTQRYQEWQGTYITGKIARESRFMKILTSYILMAFADHIDLPPKVVFTLDQIYASAQNSAKFTSATLLEMRLTTLQFFGSDTGLDREILYTILSLINLLLSHLTKPQT